MPNLNDLFPSRYLKAHDLQGHTPTVTIARVAFEVMGRTRDTLPVAYFRGKAKGLKLNKTNALVISALAGSVRTEDWVGVAVTLYAAVADFGGQAYDVVRVRAVAPVAAPRPVPVPVPPPPPVDDVEIDILDSEFPF